MGQRRGKRTTSPAASQLKMSTLQNLLDGLTSGDEERAEQAVSGLVKLGARCDSVFIGV